MTITIITLFPAMFRGPFDESIIGRAKASLKVKINILNLRDFAKNRHKTVDDKPYGGGPGMIFKPDVCVAALEHAPPGRKILLSPRGVRLTQPLVQSLSKEAHVILLCGHYEGVDERVFAFVDEAISIGDYILTGGELPAMVIADAITRLLPGVLGHREATEEESFTDNLLEYPQYTRPSVFRNIRVPSILLSGDHAKVAAWKARHRTPPAAKHAPATGVKAAPAPQQ